MSYGYSVRLLEANREADAGLLGVRLGRVCIKNRIPVSDVARRLGVTRQTVYNWFCGVNGPHENMLEQVESLLAELNK